MTDMIAYTSIPYHNTKFSNFLNGSEDGYLLFGSQDGLYHQWKYTFEEMRKNKQKRSISSVKSKFIQLTIRRCSVIQKYDSAMDKSSWIWNFLVIGTSPQRAQLQPSIVELGPYSKKYVYQLNSILY